MAHRSSTEVLVVGAGPVGLSAGLLLAQRRVPFQLIEKAPRSSERMEPIALHPATLKILSSLGLLDELMDAGIRVAKLGIYDAQGHRMSIDLARLESEFPFVVLIRQAVFEGILESRLTLQGFEVAHERRLTGLSDGPIGIQAEIDKTGTQSKGYAVMTDESVVLDEATIDAEFVIGADGADSSVRRLLGIPFEAFGKPVDLRFVDLKNELEPSDEARIVLSADAGGALWPIGQNEWSGWLEAKTPKPGLSPEWRSEAPRMTFEPKLARSFGRERAGLCGDAAHVAGPVGTRSINAGIAEAADLVARIAAQPNPKASLAPLEQYGQERRALWMHSQNMAAGALALCLPLSGAELEQALELLRGPAQRSA